MTKKNTNNPGKYLDTNNSFSFTIDSDYESFVLPSDTEELDNFIKKFYFDIAEYIIDSIEEAIKNKSAIIRLFDFKDTDFSITISKNMFKENLQNLYNVFINKEKYEYCQRLIDLLKKLD